MSSFYSERTLEYLLVPELKRVLEKNGKKVVPIFFRQLREGTLISNSMMEGKRFKILALFVRRGKLASKNSVLYSKINNSVISMKTDLNKNGISVIFGVSSAKSIYDLSHSEIYWISSDKINFTYNLDIYLTIEKNELTISNDEIFTLVENSKYYNFEEMCCFLKALRAKERMNSRILWFARVWIYEPVYFLIFDD